MNIKKGDKVKALTGKSKGKTGKVLQVFPIKEKASVEGLNLMKKHLRPRKQGESGQIIEFPAPMQISNLALICPKCNKATRVGYKKMETAGKKKKNRTCKKCKEIID